MKYAIFSDVHANDTALGYVLSDAFALGAGKVVSLGDVVGYGPTPAEALQMVRESASVALAGNHDDAVSGRIGVKDFIDLAADSVQRHREALAKDDVEWLRSLPYVAEIEGAACAHGDFTEPKAFNYVDSLESAAANFGVTKEQLLFVGHTHVPGIYLVGASGEVHSLAPQDFTCEEGKRYIVNVGSVGYPRARNGQCFSSYVLYDSTARTVVFRLLPFVVSSVVQRGLTPKRLQKRLLLGVASAVALTAGALAFVLAPRETVIERVENVTRVTVARDPSLLMNDRTLTLPFAAMSVRAGLKIQKGVPVDLDVVFLGANGEQLGMRSTTVKGSSNDRIRVPEGSVTVRFSVYRQQAKETPRIVSFTPTVVSR